MTKHPLATYLNDCRARRGTGATTGETSLYPPLETLLDAAGHGLKPRVRCFMSLKNQGAGFPDGGLFTPDQIARGADEPPPGQAPSRGVVECKKPKDPLLAVADSPQVSRYWDRYNQVLVTNYREFLLLGTDDAGNRVRYEHFKLVEAEKERYPVVPGARIKVKDDGKVTLGKLLVEWDPFTTPIMTEVSGTVMFRDIVDGVTIRPATIHHSASGKFAIRQGQWVLILAKSGDDNGAKGEPAWFKAERGYRPHSEAGELFHLSEDLSEARNSYAEHPDKVRELTALLERYVAEGRSTPGPKQANDVTINWKPKPAAQ